MLSVGGMTPFSSNPSNPTPPEPQPANEPPVEEARATQDSPDAGVGGDTAQSGADAGGRDAGGTSAGPVTAPSPSVETRIAAAEVERSLTIVPEESAATGPLSEAEARAMAEAVQQSTRAETIFAALEAPADRSVTPDGAAADAPEAPSLTAARYEDTSALLATPPDGRTMLDQRR